MKKIIAIMLATLSLSVFAGQQVPIVWPFAPGATEGVFIRTMIEEANKQQSKYTFYFESKPGAGGTVGARYVQSYNGIAILSSSSSFFARPEFYPLESYQTSDFTPVMIECTGQPYVVLSSKYKTIEDLRKQKNLTVGVILGAMAEVQARQLQLQLPDTKLTFVGFNGTLQGTQEVIAGRMDLNISVPEDSKDWIATGKVNAIGISGTKNLPNLKTFQSQGVKGFEELVGNYMMVTRTDVPSATVSEIHDILMQAARSAPTLTTLYDSAACIPADTTLEQANKSYAKWKAYWPEKLQSLKNINN
jgi:tripartite-type tricarboxylate transporter receptor subunit TctC